MINLPAVLSLMASILLLTIGVLHLVKGQRKPQKTFFILCAFLLSGAEAALGIMLLATTPQWAMTAFRFLLGFVVFFPALGIPFLLVFGKKDEGEILAARKGPIIALVILLGGIALLLPAEFVVREIHLAEGLFWGFTFSGFGKILGVVMLLANVLILYFFENTYRSATIPEKVTLKYPLLGILTASILNLVVLSRLLAISVLDKNFFAVHTSGLILLGASFLFATMRYKLFEVRVYVGRNVASSVVSILVSAIYLLILGVVSLLARTLGLPFDRLTLIVLGIFAAFALAAVLASGQVKRRIRRFIDENFYLNRFDYRKEWRRNADIVASSASVDEFLSNFVTYLCESLMAQRGVMWIDFRGGKKGSYGLRGEPFPDAAVAAITDRLTPGTTVSVEEGDGTKELAGVTVPPWVRAVARLGTSEETIGLIMLGEKSLNLTYTNEDLEFLATLADQATLALENFEMEERIIDTKQMDTFNRFASFVVHDLKNTVGMLSLTVENAKENLNDVEFQQDAIDTIRRSIEKMQSLIHSLSALGRVQVSRKKTDLVPLVKDCLESLKAIADARDIDLRFNGDDKVFADVDPQAIERVVENLVTNALDSTRTGGHVDVETRNRGTAPVHIVVTDNGQGFDEAYLQNHVFRPFHSTKSEGLGIGLVMCKTLIEAHDGTISIHSSPGEGARITVQLPSV